MSEKKRRCFVIGPIGKPGSPERKHAEMLLNAVIREALEGSDPPYEIVRSDKVAEPGMINDHVIHDILNADLVVADLTLSNANAYYELGIRHAAEKPVINFAQTGTELPFDTFGYRAIMEDITSWDGIERARQQIRDAAKAIEAEGYRVSNPITQSNASFRMRESADPKEKVLAEVLERLERLEKRSNEQIAIGSGGTIVRARPDLNLWEAIAALAKQPSKADELAETAALVRLLTETGQQRGDSEKG
jgi:nucleoside 2-deoxyribosyltransferase